MVTCLGVAGLYRAPSSVQLSHRPLYLPELQNIRRE
jgi:hypothetical protein